MQRNMKLVKFRESADMSQKEIAEHLEISLSFYIKVECGLRNPSFNFVSKFKEKFPSANINDIFFNNKLHDECIGVSNSTAGN